MEANNLELRKRGLLVFNRDDTYPVNNDIYIYIS